MGRALWKGWEGSRALCHPEHLVVGWCRIPPPWPPGLAPCPVNQSLTWLPMLSPTHHPQTSISSSILSCTVSFWVSPWPLTLFPAGLSAKWERHWLFPSLVILLPRAEPQALRSGACQAPVMSRAEKFTEEGCAGPKLSPADTSQT